MRLRLKNSAVLGVLGGSDMQRQRLVLEAQGLAADIEAVHRVVAESTRVGCDYREPPCFKPL